MSLTKDLTEVVGQWERREGLIGREICPSD